MRQTILGSARLLAESGDGPEALRAAVTSPGGTTAAGLRELERHGVRAALLDAVAAATARAESSAADLRRWRAHSSPFRPTKHGGTFRPSGERGRAWLRSRRGPRLLTVQEVAEQLRVSKMTVYRLVKSGELRALQIGKSYRLREEDVDAFLASRFTEAG